MRLIHWLLWNVPRLMYQHGIRWNKNQRIQWGYVEEYVDWDFVDMERDTCKESGEEYIVRRVWSSCRRLHELPEFQGW